MQTSRLLERDGYLGFEQLDSIEELIALTNDLGDMIPCEGKKFYNLRPSEEKGTSSRSFSYHYGLNEFPLHTDTSYWRVPARYIIFYAAERTDTYTSILSASVTQKVFSKHLENNPIFCSKTICGAIYESPWISRSDGYIKYDPCYMRPANAAAAELVADLQCSGKRMAERITWKKGQALVVDNWRCLHGRGSHASGMPRNLIRFYRKEG